jgi:hypothetical protein
MDFCDKIRLGNLAIMQLDLGNFTKNFRGAINGSTESTDLCFD